MTRRIFGCSRSGALRLGRPLHDVTGRLFDRAALSPRSRARHHQNTCAGNSQKLGMHTNLRRLRKRSPTKRGRCRLCSVPAGHGGQAWHVRFACGMTAAQFTRNDPRRANATPRGVWAERARATMERPADLQLEASGQDLRRRANSEMSSQIIPSKGRTDLLESGRILATETIRV